MKHQIERRRLTKHCNQGNGEGREQVELGLKGIHTLPVDCRTSFFENLIAPGEKMKLGSFGCRMLEPFL